MSGPALTASTEAGIAHRIIRHGPVHSVAEAAADEAAAVLGATFADVTGPGPAEPRPQANTGGRPARSAG